MCVRQTQNLKKQIKKCCGHIILWRTLAAVRHRIMSAVFLTRTRAFFPQIHIALLRLPQTTHAPAVDHPPAVPVLDAAVVDASAVLDAPALLYSAVLDAPPWSTPPPCPCSTTPSTTPPCSTPPSSTSTVSPSSPLPPSTEGACANA